MNTFKSAPLAISIALSVCLVLLPRHAGAQQMDHSMHMPPKAAPAPAPVAKPKPATKPKPAAKPATQPKPKAKPKPKPMQEAAMPAMDHAQMEGLDHSKMEGLDHSQMEGMGHPAGPGVLREPIPQLTQADRDAAFPPVHDHHTHGTSIQQYWLVDRLEVSDADPGTELGWEGSGWIGGDVQRLWLRSEGHAVGGKIERGDLEVLYGRGIRAWWDVVAGVRQDFGEGPSRTWAAVGVQGMAPYKFEVAATAYVGQGGRTALRAEAEYDTLFTNRLILQWRAEANAYGKSDPLIGIGSGLSTVEFGTRLRYEITRQFAPYIGVEHERGFSNTADLRRAAGHGAGDTRVVTGVRIWF